MRDGLVISGAAQRRIPLLAPPLHRLLHQPRLREVMRGDFGRGGSSFGKEIPERLGDPLMQSPPAALEQTLVSYILHQGVLEGINGFGRLLAPEYQVGTVGLGEADIWLGLGLVYD